jgi:hypothetical protein
MDIADFISAVELLIKEQTIRLFPADWDEDTLTRNILIEFRKRFSNKVIRDYKEDFKLSINTFKLSGKVMETNYGDIAFIVKRVYKDGDQLEGVGFLEAKRRYKKNNIFTAYKTPQLEKINTNSPQSRLLLYDYSPITEFAPVFYEPTYYDYNHYQYHHNILKSLPTTYAVTTPINVALALNKKDTTLYKISLPFSYQIAFRYFYSLDLDFNKDILSLVKGYPNEKLGLPTYTVFITVSPANHSSDAIQLDFNNELYQPLE